MMSVCRLLSLFLLGWWTLPSSRAYVVVNSVSWALTDQEKTVSTEEEVEEHSLPNRLFDSSSSSSNNINIWKASYPKEVLSFPSRMFSYRREGARGNKLDAPHSPSSPSPPPVWGKAHTARSIISSSSWGFLATLSSLDKIKGLPFGNIFSISDGLPDNSTGIPFLYVTSKDGSVLDLMDNPSASLTLPEAEGESCRENLVEPEDPRCARLTLTGKMVTVSFEEVEFAKQAMFSRHPTMKKWPPDHNCFFMKMNIQQIWLQNWFGGMSVIPLEEYFKTSPSKLNV